jgi:hypothetical protein
MKTRWILLLAVFLGGVLAAIPAQADQGVAGDREAAAAVESEAAAVRFTTFRGRVDHYAAGCSLRNFDSCTIRLRGIPTGSTVLGAFLTWGMICASTTACPSTVDIEFQGRTITSRRICIGSQPCWVAGALFAAYVVEVTGLMPGTSAAPLANKVINGDYLVSSIPSNPTDRLGGDPFVPATTALPKAEGATLVVVISNPGLAAGWVSMHLGCDFFSGTLTVVNALAIATPAAVSFAKFTRFGADGQVGSSTDASPIISNEKTYFKAPGDAVCSAPQIAGDGSLEDRDSDWNGHDGKPLNQLWDTHTTNVTPYVAPGVFSYCVKYVSLGDCMNAVGYVLTVK